MHSVERPIERSKARSQPWLSEIRVEKLAVQELMGLHQLCHPPHLLRKAYPWCYEEREDGSEHLLGLLVLAALGHASRMQPMGREAGVSCQMV